jgi:hypothetical protein
VHQLIIQIKAYEDHMILIDAVVDKIVPPQKTISLRCFSRGIWIYYFG